MQGRESTLRCRQSGYIPQIILVGAGFFRKISSSSWQLFTSCCGRNLEESPKVIDLDGDNDWPHSACNRNQVTNYPIGKVMQVLVERNTYFPSFSTIQLGILRTLSGWTYCFSCWGRLHRKEVFLGGFLCCKFCYRPNSTCFNGFNLTAAWFIPTKKKSSSYKFDSHSWSHYWRAVKNWDWATWR